MNALVIFLFILGTTIPLQLHSSQASKTELAKIATINLLDEQLINAAENNQLEELQKLLKAGANINAVNEWRQTPLIMATRNGHIAIVEALIAAKADLNAQTKNDRTALMTAASSPHMVIPKNRKKIILMLLDAGADPYIKTNQIPPQDFFSMLSGQYEKLFDDTEIQEKFAEMDVPEDKRKPAVQGAPRNKPRKIGKYLYSGHAIDQIEDRIITPEDVEWILENGCSYPANKSDRLKFAHPDKTIGVLANKEKTTIITTFDLGAAPDLQWWIAKNKKTPIEKPKKLSSRSDANQWRSHAKKY